MSENREVTTTIVNPNPVDTTLWVAQQLQAGIWAVFLSTVLLFLFSRKHVSKALEAHFSLMKGMEKGITTNSETQKKNSEAQAKLVEILRKMEATDTISRQDISLIKRNIEEILSYVSERPRRRSLRQHYVESLPSVDEDELQ